MGRNEQDGLFETTCSLVDAPNEALSLFNLVWFCAQFHCSSAPILAKLPQCTHGLVFTVPIN